MILATHNPFRIYQRRLDRRHNKIIDHIEQAKVIDEAHMAKLKAKGFRVEGQQKSRGYHLCRLTWRYVDLGTTLTLDFSTPLRLLIAL